MTGQFQISTLLLPCLLILMALQMFGSETSVSAGSNLKDVFTDWMEMEDGDYVEMDDFDERLGIDVVDRHSPKRRPFKFRHKHKHSKVNYGATSQYGSPKSNQSPKPQSTPLEGKHAALLIQNFVSVPKHQTPHRPPPRHQIAFPAASRLPGSTHPTLHPPAYGHQVLDPLPAYPHPLYPTASHPAGSPAVSYHTVSRPSASLPASSRLLVPRPAFSRPTTSRPTLRRVAPSHSTPSRSTSLHQAHPFPKLPLLPFTHPVLFGPEGLRPQTARPRISQSADYSSLSSRPPTSHKPASRQLASPTPSSRKTTEHTSSTSPSTPPPYATSFTTLALSTAASSSPESSTTASSSTDFSTLSPSFATSSTQTSSPSESIALTYISTTSIPPTSSSSTSGTAKTKKNQSKKKSYVPRLAKPGQDPLNLKEEIPIKPVYNPKSTSLSSASIANKDDKGFFFGPTNSFPDFFKQLLQG